MKTDNEIRLNELLESWINGNRSFVRNEVRHNYDFRARLALMIADHSGDEEGQKFLDDFKGGIK